MKIAESSINLSSEHSYLEKYRKHEELTYWVDGKDRKTVLGNNKVTGSTIEADKYVADGKKSAEVLLSKEALQKPNYTKKIATPVSEENAPVVDLNIRILKALIERMTGKKIDISTPEKIQNANNEQITASPPQGNTGDSSEGAGDIEGFGVIYEFHESYEEHEKMSFTADGIIRTEDGMEIAFTASLEMSRSFISEKNISIRAGDALKDPLVINFDGTGAGLSENHFAFDIDSDGIEDQIQFVDGGSGFLALDKNGDGTINNGGELFGADTGNGFQELSAYDSDNNGWIDENDEIYQNLRIWQLDGSGNKTLVTLGEKGVGAIYLGHVESPFSIKDNDNSIQAQVRQTGIFLFEDGRSGTVQQVDLAV